MELKEVEVELRAAEQSSVKRQVPLGPTPFDVPVGMWEIRAAAPGYWAEAVRVFVGNDGATTDVSFWPAGSIAGVVRSSDGKSRIESMEITYSAVNQADGNSCVTTGRVACPVSDGVFSCTLPAGTFDLGFHAQGFATHFRWAESIALQKARRVGSITLHPGASLVGRVRYVGRQRLSEAIRVSLKPRGSPSRGIRPITAASTFADSKGFFQFHGLREGGYVLAASAAGTTSEDEIVTIRAGMEASLRDPLVLDDPTALTVKVVPPIDPWKKPWIANLHRVDEDYGELTLIQHSDVEQDGVLTISGLRRGTYRLEIARAQGTWASRTFRVERDTEIDIEIPTVRVLGRTTLGGEPLQAYVWFGGEHGTPSVPVASNADGFFKTILPAVDNNVWRDVEVVAQQPPVRRVLSDISVDPGSKPFARVEIDLPGTALTGEVVDSDGRPVPKALVTVSGSGMRDTPIQMDADAAGGFSFSGLVEGTISLRATTGELESEVEDVTIGSDASSSLHVRLVAKPHSRFSGRVTGLSGPVGGARLFVIPDDARMYLAYPITTSLDGRFEHRLPPGARSLEFVVSAPGFATRLRSRVIDGQDADVVLDQRAGTLIVNADGVEEARRQRVFLFLFHDRTHMPIYAFERMAGARSRYLPGAVETTIDSLEEGQWTVCFATYDEAALLTRTNGRPDRCQTGFLAAGRTLELSAKFQHPH